MNGDPLYEPWDVPTAIAWLKGRAQTRCDKGAGGLAWSLDDVKAVRAIAEGLPEYDVEKLRIAQEQAA